MNSSHCLPVQGAAESTDVTHTAEGFREHGGRGSLVSVADSCPSACPLVGLHDIGSTRAVIVVVA